MDLENFALFFKASGHASKLCRVEDKMPTNQICVKYSELDYYLPKWSSGKESASNARDVGSTPWSRRSPGEGNCNPLQYSCLGNSMDREPIRLHTLYGVAKESDGT